MKLVPAIVFGSNMILQRNKPIAVWGKCAAGDTVRVTLGEHTASCVSERGKWQVTLPAMEACEATSMRIESETHGDVVILDNVAIGEVWLAGGQSNMEFLLKYDVNAAELIPSANDPLLRFFDMPEVTFAGHYELGWFEQYGFWRSWCPKDAPWFSAVGYYFARQLREKLNVPVGILGCNYGGTVSSAWTDKETLQTNGDLRPVLDFYEKSLSTLDYKEYYRALEAAVLRDPSIMQPMLDRLMMGEKIQFTPPSQTDPNAPKPIFMFLGPQSQNAPSVLYENMVKAVMPYTIRGFIWYQGESDEDHGWASFYDKSISAMIESWRKGWGEELPFLQVMLAPFWGWGMARAKEYPLLRRMQLKVCSEVPQTYCACIMDAGDAENIHPRRKQPAGERLALLARKYVYGEENLDAWSPRAASAIFEGDDVVISFSDCAGGLIAEGGVKAIKAFAGDTEVENISAIAKGDKVIVSSPDFSNCNAVTIKYAEENYCEPNLTGGTGLPAFPFTIKAVR